MQIPGAQEVVQGGAEVFAPLLIQHQQHQGHPGASGHLSRGTVRHYLTLALLTDGSLPWGRATHWAQLGPPRLQPQPRGSSALQPHHTPAAGNTVEASLSVEAATSTPAGLLLLS